MTDLILILSECESSLIKNKNKEIYYRFHFNGFYQGIKIKELFIKPNNLEKLEIGELYLLWVKKQQIINGRLVGNLLALKKII